MYSICRFFFLHEVVFFPPLFIAEFDGNNWIDFKSAGCKQSKINLTVVMSSVFGFRCDLTTPLVTVDVGTLNSYM